jgi:protocatechuate 3,4-dioxygenase beta subunit
VSGRSGPKTTARRLSGLPVILLVALAAAVGGRAAPASTVSTSDASTCPAFNPPNELTLAGGTPQSAKIGFPFAAPLQVGLDNSNGCPVTTSLAGIAVTLTAPPSGPSGTFSASGSNVALVGTSASGQATAPQFTANSLSGGYQIVATSDLCSVSFSLVNTASGVAATVAALPPQRQSATVSNRYGHPLQAEVTDATGAPVPGATVAFQLGVNSGGGGSGANASEAGANFVGGSSQATEMTDAAGVAVSPPIVANGTAGKLTATATTAGMNATATFVLDNLAARPSHLTALGAGRQSTTTGARFRRPLEVKLQTAQGGPVQGASVTFTLGAAGAGAGSGAAAAGASFVGGATQATETTNAKGIATSPTFTANTTAGTFTATATTSGTTSAVSFRLDNLAARPPTLTATRDPKRTATVGAAYPSPLQVRVLASGKPLQGASVTFTLGAAGAGAGSGAAAAGASFVGGATQATETTNAKGIATSPTFTANTTAGTFTATVTIGGTTRAAGFTLHNLPARVATIIAGAASGESTTAGTRFPIRLAVTVDDKHGNAVPDAVVTFAAPENGPSGLFDGTHRTVEVKTDAGGVAVAPPFVAGPDQGGYVVRASVRALPRSAAFALINLPA